MDSSSRRGAIRRATQHPLARAAVAALLPAIVVVIVAFVVRWHDGYLPIARGCCSDHSYYLAMAGGLPGHPDAAHTPPFDYRILTPLIVRLLPLSPTAGFHALTMAALIGAAALLWQLLRTLGFARGASAGGVLLLGSLYWLIEFPQMDYALVDPMSFFLAALFMLALYRGAGPLTLGAIATLAVLNKEAGLILLPSGVLYLWRTRRLTRTTALAFAGAPMVAVAFVRLLVPSDGAYHPLAVLQATLPERYGSWSRAFHDVRGYFIPTWGPVLLVIVAQPQSLVRFVRRFPELALLYPLAHLQLLVATDTSRVLVFAYLAVIPAIIFALREGLRLDRLVLASAILLAVAQGFYFEYTRLATARFAGARTSFDPAVHDCQWPAVAAGAAIALLIAAPAWRRSRPPAPSESSATL
jgi:hypothetical protein